MRFKRPQVRYADSRSPCHPVSSRRPGVGRLYGSARVQAKNWRLMASAA